MTSESFGSTALMRSVQLKQVVLVISLIITTVKSGLLITVCHDVCCFERVMLKSGELLTCCRVYKSHTTHERNRNKYNTGTVKSWYSEYTVSQWGKKMRGDWCEQGMSNLTC